MPEPKSRPISDRLLLLLLVLLDIAIHPLGTGPDRLVHDPAVYRLSNPNYLPGDWYTDMATQSGVYTFYAHLVNAWHNLHIPEELWRLAVYLTCLVILYYSLVRIARLFSANRWVVPIIAVLHASLLAGGRAPWLYGPFIQVDGGLAPRSVGVALSFLALYFLLTNSLLACALVLGLATLIHVSNSLIIFSLFLLAWVIQQLLTRQASQLSIASLTKKTVGAVLVYLVAGGWLALKLALVEAPALAFPTAKFIWAWVYFRAPYFALLQTPSLWWLLFLMQGVIIIVGARYLKKRLPDSTHQALGLLSIIGLAGIAYLLGFYFFAFVRPWLPGFQFYSIRVIYLTYFVSFLYLGLIVSPAVSKLVQAIKNRLGAESGRYWSSAGLLLIVGFLWSGVGQSYANHLQTSWWRLLDSSVRLRPLVAEDRQVTLPSTNTYQYLLHHPEPFLAPPNWSPGTIYLPSVASFKSFGFTPEGLPAWYNRLNDISGGQLEQTYLSQLASGRFEPVVLDWPRLYSQLTADRVVELAERYRFRLFMSYSSLDYPFDLVTEDNDWRVYRIPPTFDE